MDASPFSGMLKTNDVPSDSEGRSILDLLTVRQQEAADLTNEAARLRALLDEVTTKLEKVNTFVDAHRALVSPASARRLPDDVVQEIFEAALPSERNAVMSESDAPLLLCHISHGWRQLAFSTPRLWSSIHIVAQTTLHRLNEAVKAWVGRAGEQPLSISFVTPSSSDHPHIEWDLDLLPLLETLIQCASRWRNIVLSFPACDFFAPLAVLSPRDVPMLRSVVVKGFRAPTFGFGFNPLPGPDHSILSFLGTPRLRSVSLHSVTFAQVPLCWNDLAHLTMLSPTAFSSFHALDVLRLCPNLETCTLSINMKSRNVPGIIPPCHMDRLWRLSFVDHLLETDFFQYLRLPNLRSLECVYTSLPAHHVGQLPCFAVLPFIDRLKSLSIYARNLQTTVLLEGLRAAPMLRALTLSGEPVIIHRTDETTNRVPDARFVHLLTPYAAQDPTEILCPHLQRVTFLFFISLSDDALRDFILARTDPARDPDSQLTAVHVRFNRLQQLDILPELQERIALGLDVSLTYGLPNSTPYNVRVGNEPYDEEWGPISSRWASGAENDPSTAALAWAW
ncbi:hypothetical protein B0H11DRAFT_2430955 [Mycena galericulata]|nr:hypothetical protein B0H11DRAFT_2430955 [Mycena galericulata]